MKYIDIFTSSLMVVCTADITKKASNDIIE